MELPARLLSKTLQDRFGRLGASGWVARGGCPGWDSVVLNNFDEFGGDLDCGPEA
jgi:hypothetical protein